MNAEGGLGLLQIIRHHKLTFLTVMLLHFWLITSLPLDVMRQMCGHAQCKGSDHAAYHQLCLITCVQPYLCLLLTLQHFWSMLWLWLSLLLSCAPTPDGNLYLLSLHLQQFGFVCSIVSSVIVL